MSVKIVINSLVGCLALVLLSASSRPALAGQLANQLGNKVFDYQGSMPIKDERVGDWNGSAVSDQAGTQMKPEDQKAAELACWKLISEESVVTFALQNRVLDQLDVDLKSKNISSELCNSVDKISAKMRNNMKAALDALKRDKADEFFDYLFEASENIINMSSMLRDPTVEDEAFVSLVRAVSYLGRNNAALITEFTEMCSFMTRSPKPRRFSDKPQHPNSKLLRD